MKRHPSDRPMYTTLSRSGRKWMLLLILGLFMGTGLKGQDPHFSQFYANRIFLNPAFTGVARGLSLSTIARLQWFAADNGYKSYNAAVEWQEPVLRSGIGLNVYGSYDGLLTYSTTSVGVAYAYTIPWENNNLHVGIQGRWIQHRIDWSKAIFSDQLDPIFGANRPTGANVQNDATDWFDFDFGILWRHSAKRQRVGHTISQPRYAVGLAIHHLPSIFTPRGGQGSLLGLPNSVPARLTIHAAAMFPVTLMSGSRHELIFSPHFKFDLQSDPFLSFGTGQQLSALGAFFMINGIFAGAFYQDKWPIPVGGRNTNAAIFAGGFYLGPDDGPDFQLSFSVDVNFSGLGITGGNVFELALRYNFTDFKGFARKRHKENNILECYNFF